VPPKIAKESGEKHWLEPYFNFGGRKFFNYKSKLIINFAIIKPMNQKGFVNILLIILVVVLAGALGYVTLVKKPAPTEQSQSNNLQNTQPTPPPVVKQNPPPTQPPVVEADINLTYPNGGDVLSLSQSVNINYKVGAALKQKLSTTDKTEIYLLNSQNILVGYIGKFDVNSGQFVFNPQQLIHNGGLDTTSGSTPAGQYRVLVVVRPPFKPKCTNCDAGVDTLDNPYTSYSNGKFINGGQLIETQPIASDVSASLFTFK